MRCATCGHEWDPAPEPKLATPREPSEPAVLPAFRCPACGRAGAEVLRGDELEVESIEVEDDRTAQPSPSGTTQ